MQWNGSQNSTIYLYKVQQIKQMLRQNTWKCFYVVALNDEKIEEADQYINKYTLAAVFMELVVSKYQKTNLRIKLKQRKSAEENC